MTDIDEMAADLVAALSELSELARDKKANTGTYSYSYTDLASVLTYARPILSKHGLAVSQTVETQGSEVGVGTRILHKSGAVTHYPTLFLPRGGTPQQTGSAITYARRYSLLAALGLATEDDDGKKASAAPKPAKPAPKPNTAARKRVLEIAGGKLPLAQSWWKDLAGELGKGPDDELTPEEADTLIRGAEVYAEQQVNLEAVPATNREAMTKARKVAFDEEHWQAKVAGVDTETGEVVEGE